ncbi:MAG: LacI family transcriptional regulator [Ignavibacteriae bacterium]|nr:MAG: LacI family transcriptional regulator [Ignavibacteriota bacterium]
MTATIYDVAKQASVGIGTVSRVLNKHASVSQKTRKRVLQVVSKLNYRPHPFAIGLARQRTNSILFTIPFFATFFFLEILRGIQKRLSDLDVSIILLGINHPDQITETLRNNIHRHRVDGIVLCSMKIPDQLAKIALFKKLPMVLVDTYHKKFDSIAVNNVRGGYTATKHLLDLGHTRIAMLNANLRSVPAKDRFKGYQMAMMDAHKKISNSLVLKTKSEYLDGFTRENGYEMMKELLKLGPKRPTAVFAASDIQAYGALAAIAEMGLRCPRDIAVIGFDDLELSGPLGLTSMLQPMSEMGMLTVERLLDRFENPGLPIYHKTFEPTLIVRRSTLPMGKITKLV